MISCRKKSFTVIELMVGVSIIGLVASIILINLKGPTEKARIVKSLQFSQNINNALGAEAAGIWSFDDCSAGTIKDASGYGNNGIIFGASCTDDTPFKLVGTSIGRYALNFDGSSNYVQIPGLGYSLESAFTIEAWIKLDAYPDAGSPGIGQIGYNKAIYINTQGYVGFGARAVAPPYLEFEDTTTKLKIGQWYHVAGTFLQNGANMVGKIYVNGVNVASNSVVNTPYNTVGQPIRMGTVIHNFADYLDGLIDDVRIYRQSLISAEIQKHYAAGLEEHQNLVTDL